MNKALKIFLLICLIVLFIFSVWSLFFSFQIVKVNAELYAEFSDPKISYNNGNDLSLFVNNIIIGSVVIIFSFISMFFAVFISLKIWHFPKYIYEEYKAIMDKKKAEKQERKKQKLQQQLNNFENTD